MAPKFPNPPLAEMDHEQLVTVEEAADRLGVRPVTIRQWVFTGKVEKVPLGGGGPDLYYYHCLALAEHDAYENGADRPARGGRKPGWKPCAGRVPGQRAA